MNTIAKITFKSPINIDDGHKNHSQGTHESTMELYHGSKTGVYVIEWIVDALDIVEHIGIYCSQEDKVITDYDGVFELPRQAIDMLKANGFTSTEIIDWNEEEVKEGGSKI